jgi:8-oxo-dGTP pyrophosphatase MutT (NUDIX family)
MLYEKIPKKFNPRFEIVSCFLECDGKILLLLRQDHKPQGNTWGVPAGKADGDGDILENMTREINEETGISIPPQKLSYFKKVFVKYSNYDFVYHMYHAKISQPQEVSINPKEHMDFQWISPKKALNLPLIQDLDACIKMFY